ncbi:tetraprenyl-beta-curcumene synthase family protein [Bacillus pinisoli]|uniref:tetraprenyl-beta-curcumene synthase family protein n=1 Tax=Bacillus pinisoli TaxID=2901866 RepID=UPI001FF1F0FF|nr:tetraprenyl-beta-curcumene synthase family protein [Bacillus pinisoli]
MVPSHPLGLMTKVYREVFPIVHKELDYWRGRAASIPNQELRTQALASIGDKSFHCEGGSILALLSIQHLEPCIKFIVAYQTISDYLDNLCDRSTSLDPQDFEALHESMPNALTVESEHQHDYYRFREDQDDGAYLKDLVLTCQSVLKDLPHYSKIKSYIIELANYYCSLQVHKHVKHEERVPRLEKWFSTYKSDLPEMEWYEFSACSGSTLGIFCLVSYAFQPQLKEEDVLKIRQGYFPYVQGLHILLDYLIDQEEDKAGGDLNFCTYYPSEEAVLTRLSHFLTKADDHISGIPHEVFHRFINRGLLGVYLSDQKVLNQRAVQKMAKQLIKQGGFISFFFYWNGRMYRKWKQMKEFRNRSFSDRKANRSMSD